MKETHGGLERILDLSPAWDKRSADPKTNYGIHGADLRLVVKGPLGAVQFLLFTGWDCKKIRAEQRRRSEWGGHVMAADLGYHSPRPMYEGQGEQSPPGECPYVPAGSSCYYDGSGLNAERIFDTLTDEGEEAAWAALEDYYAATFSRPAVEEAATP